MHDSTRRNFFIRTVAVVAGDIALGAALASACVWLIKAAALGLFLSFIAWLLMVLLSLVISQHVVHPAMQALLSDRKLDDAVGSVRSLVGWIQHGVQGWRRV